MSAASEPVTPGPLAAHDVRTPDAPHPQSRVRFGLAVVVLLAAALGLRLWGIKSGLPFVYNIDENAHFVPKAIGLFGHSWNPGYFVNPPGLTYLLHGVFAVWFGGRDGVSVAYAANPTEVFVVARVTAAILGTLAVWLLYLAGTRLFADRRVGLLAAALLGVGFLPVYYSHLALNDVPALVPVGLALLGVAGVLRRGRLRDYALAGVGIGLAAATKYTAGIMVLPLLAAALPGVVDPTLRRRALRGALLGGALALATFVAVNPYAVLDPHSFRLGLATQSSASADDTGKLGLSQDSGILYYLWTLTWGLGWVPALAAAAGSVWLWRKRPELALVLVPGPLLFIVFMGLQDRFFGRWLLPVVPLICLLAAYAAVAGADALRERRPRLAPAVLALGVAALTAQALVYVVHSGRVNSRDDTRNLAREWMVAHIPAGSKIVVEPIAPDQWAQDPGHPSPKTSNGNRWIKFVTSKAAIFNSGKPTPGGYGRPVKVEDYERILRPALFGSYTRGGFCWVISGSTQYGRALADPLEVPRAIEYYRTLDRHSRIVHRVSPYDPGARRVKFNFDWSFDYYPLAYRRPGPEVVIRRLQGGQCR